MYEHFHHTKITRYTVCACVIQNNYVFRIVFRIVLNSYVE